MEIPRILPSGRVVDVLDLQPSDINVWDIAWCLSKIDRYAGATPYPWPVTAHTARCVALAQVQEPGLSDQTKLAIWLHDAAEAYVGDVMHHIKLKAGTAGFDALENAVSGVIKQAFGVDDSAVDLAVLKYVDAQEGVSAMAEFWPGCDLSFNSVPAYAATPANAPGLWRAEQINEAWTFVDQVGKLCPNLVGTLLFALPPSLSAIVERWKQSKGVIPKLSAKPDINAPFLEPGILDGGFLTRPVVF